MKKINREMLIQSVILVISACFIAFGLVSGIINKYVHPRFNPGLWVSVIILFVFAFSILNDNRKGRHNVNWQKYLICIVPLIFAVAFPITSATNSNMVMYGNALSASIQNNNQGILKDEQKVNNDQNKSKTAAAVKKKNGIQNTQQAGTDQKSGGGKGKTDFSDAYHGNKINGGYKITDRYFANWFFDLYYHQNDFIGERYQFLAQVYNMKKLKNNQIVAERKFMICCAADMVDYGLICECNDKSLFKNNEWITVTGTVTKEKYNGSEVPVLKNTVIKQAKAPKVEYVYYNY